MMSDNAQKPEAVEIICKDGERLQGHFFKTSPTAHREAETAKAHRG